MTTTRAIHGGHHRTGVSPLPQEDPMSGTIATRTTRFAPPAPPTRKAGSRRTVVGQASSVVGRCERPVLRIVVDDERAPVLTRVLPSVERSSSGERASSVELVETTPRRI